jgi:hypothetical protein
MRWKKRWHESFVNSKKKITQELEKVAKNVSFLSKEA